MSDTIFKIFPRYSYQIFSDEQILGAVNMLKRYSKEEITFTNYGDTQFIDCGEGLEHIFCQWCGKELDIRWWQEAMDGLYENNSFKHFGITMPCCKLPSILDELIYVKPCGFATFVIEVFNPTVIPCVVELKQMGARCFGNAHFFRMISAHI